MNSTNRQIQVEDKLQIKIKGKFYDDIITVTNIYQPYGKNEDWISHTPNSFSGGSFRLQTPSIEGYLLNRDFIFYDDKQEFLKDINYDYLIPMLI
jgi:hypothetical protein